MLIGIVIGIVVMLVLFLCVYIAYKLTRPKKVLQDKDELESLRKRDEGIKNIMDYDYNIAMGKRVSK